MTDSVRKIKRDIQKGRSLAGFKGAFKAKEGKLKSKETFSSDIDSDSNVGVGVNVKEKAFESSDCKEMEVKEKETMPKLSLISSMFANKQQKIRNFPESASEEKEESICSKKQKKCEKEQRKNRKDKKKKKKK